ncbi:glycosyltransferase family 4 protein [Oxynema aestuarii]|jgi:glycosyltransferase involved in cell wall biosynthesis|uniref:Glycosyltransferase family 4 protein n=1 Tax=Oxynema aestuarii AP17 TaxID=2064643 RepID=A0A6H1U1F6_9CYAN|nr:glycosyltransferase family 4 protein [Oxynema aestuarii]QIZ72485.1 glycosyltransferase family 4 protein [Oxynema aestuarii AP17]
MHIVVIFYNIGGYHAARLRAACAACQAKGWRLSAIQVTDNTRDHPWGDVKQEIAFPLKTLLPVATTPASVDRGRFSAAPAPLVPGCLDLLQPDLVAIPGWGFPVSRAALAWCQRYRIPTILMSESKWDDEKRQWWKEQIKFWQYVRKYDAALVGGELHRDYLVKLGFPSQYIFFGYDAVDNNYFKQGAETARQAPSLTRKRQPAIPRRPYFLTVTRLIERKNVLGLVEAFAAYRQQVGDEQAWNLVICGSGQEEISIRHVILEKGLKDCVHLPGFITYQEIRDWYGLANAFVHPALQEQWGLVVNEACAAGLPILCSQTVGACHELVRDPENGRRFNPKSQQDMTRALLDIHQLDSDSRIKMGQYSQKIVATYSPQRFAEGFLNAIDAAITAK